MNSKMFHTCILTTFLINFSLCSIVIEDVAKVLPEIPSVIETMGMDGFLMGSKLSALDTSVDNGQTMALIMPNMKDVLKYCADTGRKIEKLVYLLKNSLLSKSSSQEQAIRIPSYLFNDMENKLTNLSQLVVQMQNLHLIQNLNQSHAVKFCSHGRIEMPYPFVLNIMSTFTEFGTLFGKVKTVFYGLVDNFQKSQNYLQKTLQSNMGSCLELLDIAIGFASQMGTIYGKIGQTFNTIVKDDMNLHFTLSKHSNGVVYISFDGSSIMKVFRQGAGELGKLFDQTGVKYDNFASEIEMF